MNDRRVLVQFSESASGVLCNMPVFLGVIENSIQLPHDNPNRSAGQRVFRGFVFDGLLSIFDFQGADLPFVVILDLMTGSDPKITDYILETPAKCPNCKREILEKTLIERA